VDTVHTATALLGYAPQLPFIGLDQLLIVAFYARHNTLTPALVGVAGVGIYVVSAAILLGRLTILGLALANTIQIGAHALILLVLLLRAVGSLPLTKFPRTVGKVCLATGGMTAAILAVQHWLSPNGAGSYAHFVAVSLPIVIAIAVYGGLLLALQVEEATLLWRAIRVKVGGG
jgi:putative peptidoglycan lipid II flippase